MEMIILAIAILIMSVFQTLFMFYGTAISYRIKHKKNLYLTQNVKYSMTEVIQDIEVYTTMMITEYKYKNLLTDNDIYINKDRFNNDVIQLSSEIINSFSNEFIMRVNLFITEEALYAHVTAMVIRELANYATWVNQPK